MEYNPATEGTFKYGKKRDETAMIKFLCELVRANEKMQTSMIDNLR